MIEFLFEVIFESIVEIVIEVWTNRKIKKDPNYNNTRSKKIVTGIFKFIIVVMIVVILLAILFLIEWLFPDLLDIVN